jgi:hypothetical protein
VTRPFGYTFEIPRDVYDKARTDCLKQSWDVKRLQREMSERLKQFVPSLMAEVLYDEFHGR